MNIRTFPTLYQGIAFILLVTFLTTPFYSVAQSAEDSVASSTDSAIKEENKDQENQKEQETQEEEKEEEAKATTTKETPSGEEEFTSTTTEEVIVGHTTSTTTEETLTEERASTTQETAYTTEDVASSTQNIASTTKDIASNTDEVILEEPTTIETYTDTQSNEILEPVTVAQSAKEQATLNSFSLSDETEGEGTYFEIIDSDYYNVSLSSEEEILARLSSVPEMITLRLESINSVDTATMTLRGLPANTTFHLYEDSYENHTLFTTDVNGSYTWIQDIEDEHYIFIQPRPSTLFIRDDADGGDCTTVGTWNSGTKTCTLTTDVNESIEIADNDITLDGDGYTVTGSNTGNGVLVSEKENITIQDIVINGFIQGFQIDDTRDILLDSVAVTSSNGIRTSRSNATIQNSTIVSESQNRSGFGFSSRLSTTTLRDNTISGFESNFSVSVSYEHDIDTSNTVEGKPVYYIKDATNQIFNSTTNAGVFYCIRCSNVIIRDLVLNYNSNGISLIDSNDITIEGNSIGNSSDGIELSNSSGVTIQDNTFQRNEWADIHTRFSDDVNVRRNNLVSGIGWFHINIRISRSNNHTIYNNNFSSRNSEYIRADRNSTNIVLNTSLPQGGNYWRGNNCEDVNIDGICDTSYSPYNRSNNLKLVDNYPWTTENGWLDTTTPEIDPLILQYEPILYMHPDETYRPMNVEAFVEASALWNQSGGDTQLYAVGELPMNVFESIVEVSDTSDYYLAYSDPNTAKSMDPDFAKTKYNLATSTGDAVTTVYYHKMTDGYTDSNGIDRNFIVLQYWYFYAFNDWAVHGGTNNHEGDWESVFVFLDADTEEPEYVAYSSHLNDGYHEGNIFQYDSVRRNWDSNEVVKDNNQIVSFVALGSHANYPNNGNNGVHTIVPLVLNDFTSEQGDHLETDDWITREEITGNDPIWMDYEGKWGADSLDVGGGESGPQGPNFLAPLFGGGVVRFHEPIEWAGIDQIVEETVEAPEENFSFTKQLIEMLFEEALEVGETISVDLHDEVISFGENISELNILPRFWDLGVSLPNGTFNVAVTLSYDQAEVDAFGIDENNLTVYFYNGETSLWEEVESLLDTVADTVLFETDHFSRYAIGVAQEETTEEIYDRLHETIKDSKLSKKRGKILRKYLKWAEYIGNKPHKRAKRFSIRLLKLTERKVERYERRGQIDEESAEQIYEDIDELIDRSREELNG